jgi:hypothetical protein
LTAAAAGSARSIWVSATLSRALPRLSVRTLDGETCGVAQRPTAVRRPLLIAFCLLAAAFEWLTGAVLARVARSTLCEFSKLAAEVPAIAKAVLPVEAVCGGAIGLLFSLSTIGIAFASARPRSDHLACFIAVLSLFVLHAFWATTVVYSAWLRNQFC